MDQGYDKIKRDKEDVAEKSDTNYNMFAIYLSDAVEKYTHKLGTVFPYCQDEHGRTAYTHLTYEQMDKESNRYAHGLVERGVEPGSRVLLLVPPCLEFTVLFASLFKIGAIPVLIDPGMGIFPMLKSIQTVKPDAFIGIPLAHVARTFFRKYFNSVKLSVTIGRRWLWRGPKLEDLRSDNIGPYPTYKAKKDETSGIFFTTGSTGIPKGVVYTHKMIKALAERLQDFFNLGEYSIDMPAFPPFALFCMAFGGTSVIPEMDPSEPAKADPEKLVTTIKDYGVNVSYGSPSIWTRVCNYCEKNDIKLPSLNHLMMFGAPVPFTTLKIFQNIMPNGETYTPYGATESLFVTNITGSEVCAETASLTKQGYGVCVGYVVPGMELRIIQITDDVINLNNKDIGSLTVPQGEVGEIIVRGPYVTEEYFGMPEKTKRAKIYDGDTVWHRMGDLGYLDEKERLWYCGRKSHRMRRKGTNYYPVKVEAHFNQLEWVNRTAMVGIPSREYGQFMVIIIELIKENLPRPLKRDKSRKSFLIDYARERDQPVDAILFKKNIPVDIRHNAKIKRDVLAEWAEKELEGYFR